MIDNIQKSIEFKKLVEAFAVEESFNVFKVIGIENYEIRHSNVLAWLLDKSENHGLGTLFLEKFISGLSEIKANQESKPDLPKMGLDTEDYSVYREWYFPGGYIDILLEFPKRKLVIAIENKLGTTDAENQLDAYRNVIIAKYKNSKRLFIYLTPHGDVSIFSKDREWLSQSYEQISQILKSHIIPAAKNVQIRDFLSMYYITVQKYLLENQALLEFASVVYQGNKEFFDRLLEANSEPVLAKLSVEEGKAIKYVMNTQSEIAGIIYQITKESVKEHGYQTRNSSLKNTLLFSSAAMQAFCTGKFSDSIACCFSVTIDAEGYILTLHAYNKSKDIKKYLAEKTQSNPALIQELFNDSYITRYYRRVLLGNAEIVEHTVPELKRLVIERFNGHLESDLKAIEQIILAE